MVKIIGTNPKFEDHPDFTPTTYSTDESIMMGVWITVMTEHKYVTRKMLLDKVGRKNREQLIRGLNTLLEQEIYVEREVGRILELDEGKLDELSERTGDDYWSDLSKRENQLIQAAECSEQKGIIFENDLIAELQDVIKFDDSKEKTNSDTSESTLKKDIDEIIETGILKVEAK